MNEAKMKFGLQIETKNDEALPEGVASLIVVVDERAESEPGKTSNRIIQPVFAVNVRALNFEASKEGAENIRDLFRHMADAIDAELGNTVVQESVRATFNPHARDAVLPDTPQLANDDARSTGSIRKPRQFNPTPKKDNPRKPMGLAKQREKKRNRD